MFNYLFGSLSRIFTTLQEVDDNLILYSFIAAFTLNLVLAFQMLYYWNSPGKAQQPKKKTVEKAPAATRAESSGVAAKPAAKTPTTRRRG